MASQGDLQAAQIKWRARANASRQRGIPDSAWAGLAKQDLANVAQGHAAMDDAQVNDAILGAMHQSPVQTAAPSHSGPLDILGNIGSDVRDIVTGFIPGTVGYIASLPQQMGDFYDLTGLAGQDAKTHAQQKYGMETDMSPGAFIRDMARTPVFAAWLPGLHTAAELTSSQGRQQLEEHPIGTALDVLPVAAEGGKLATAGLSEGEDFSVTQALQQGKPATAAYRTVMDTASKVPRLNRMEFLDRPHVRQWASDHALLPSQIVDKFMRPLGERTSVVEGQMEQWMNQDGGVFDSMSKMSDQELRTFTDALTGTGKVAIDSLPLDQQVLVGQYKEFLNQMFEESQTLRHAPVRFMSADGKMHIYAEDDPVARAHAKMVKEQTKLEAKTQEHRDLSAATAKRKADFEGTHDKMRKMNESDAEYAAREAGPVTNKTIINDAAPFIESFRHLDPTQVYARVLEAPARYRPQLLADMEKLGGEDGLVAKWSDALVAEDYKTASQMLTQIQNLLRDHKSWDKTPYARAFRAHLDELRRVTKGLRDSTRSIKHRGRLYQKALRLEQESLKSLESQRTSATNAMQEFHDAASKTAPAEFQPILLKQVRERGIQQVKDLEAAHEISAQQAAETIKGIEESSSVTEFGKYVTGGEKEAKQWIAEAQASWVELSKSGVNPIFVHNVDPSKLEWVAKPHILPDRLDRAGFTRGRIFTLGDSVHNVRAAIVDMKQQQLSEMGTQAFVDEIMRPIVEDEVDITERVRKAVQADGRYHSRRVMYDENAIVDREMKKHWVKFDPSKYGFSKYYQSPAGKTMMIPKGFDVALQKMTIPSGLPFKGVLDPTMKLWRFAVLTTPRHMAHIALGGMTMGALREGPGWFLEMGRGLKIARGEDLELQAKLSMHVNDTGNDDVFRFAAGKTQARLAAEAAGGPIRFLNKWEENIAGMYKAAAMLHEMKKNGGDMELALRQANKVFVDMNALTPFERTTMRQLMPFYGFARHIFRYLFTFPSDHPLRAAILSNFARMQTEAFSTTGLPGTMQFMFFLGGQDAQGNRTGVDYRSIDPFRSFFNDFTLAGVTSQLNPLLQVGLQEMGVNTLSATPELYPGLHYDPYTGSMVADRPPNGLLTAAEAIVPELNTVDAYLAMSDTYRNLARTDPNAFRKRLYTSLGIPFGPVTENIPLDIQRQQIKKYKDADSAISSAITTGDFSKAKQYDYVPIPSLVSRFFPGYKYATPGDIETVYNQIRTQLDASGQSGISVHAILPKPRSQKVPLL